MELNVNAKDLGFYTNDIENNVVEPGEFTIMTGPNSGKNLQTCSVRIKQRTN